MFEYSAWEYIRLIFVDPESLVVTEMVTAYPMEMKYVVRRRHISQFAVSE